jgi:hypothetical protein
MTPPELMRLMAILFPTAMGFGGTRIGSPYTEDRETLCPALHLLISHVNTFFENIFVTYLLIT